MLVVGVGEDGRERRRYMRCFLGRMLGRGILRSRVSIRGVCGGRLVLLEHEMGVWEGADVGVGVFDLSGDQVLYRTSE